MKTHAYTSIVNGTTFCGMEVYGRPSEGYTTSAGRPIKVTRRKPDVDCKRCVRSFE